MKAAGNPQKGECTLRKWRKMTWAILVWTALMAVWAIAGAASNNCGSQKGDQYLSAHDAQAACAAGTGIGVALIFFLWFIGFIILAIVWFMSRPKGRACPRCGENVKRGVMQCRSCGFDFATMGQPSSRQTVAT